MNFKRFEQFDSTKNFWNEFPEFKAVDCFNNLYHVDTSKDKVKSSTFLWAIHYCLHPKSAIYNDSAKWEQVNKTMLKDSPVNWDSPDVMELTQQYLELALSPGERAFHSWCGMILKRDKFLKDLEYNLENGKALDAMHKTTHSIYQDFEKIQKILKAEQDSVKSNKSASDLGRL